MDVTRLLSAAFLEAHPAEASRVLEQLPVPDAGALLAESDARVASLVVREMVAPSAAECMAAMPPARAAAMVGALDGDVAAGILRCMTADARDAVLAAAEPATAASVGLLLRYPPGTAGSLMDPRIVVVPSDVTVGEAIERVRRAQGRVLYYVYLVDRDQRIVGVVNMRELMVADHERPISAVARHEVSHLPPSAMRAAIIAHPKWRDVHAMPVADASGKLLGALRYGTFRRLETEAAADRRRQSPVVLLFGLGHLYWAFIQQLLLVGSALFARTRGPRPARAVRS